VLFAVVRKDSVLIPFAWFSSGGWFSSRQDGLAADTVGDIADRSTAWFATVVPSSSLWYYWRTAGLPASVNAGAPSNVDAHCQKAWALPFAITGAVTLPASQHGNLTIAANRPGLVSLPIPLADSSALFRRISEEARGRFPQSESAFLSRAEDWVKRWLSEPPRDGIAVTVTRVSPLRAPPAYHVVAERRYGTPTAAGSFDCPATSRLTTWAHVDAEGRLQLSAPEHAADACDRKNMPDIRVLASANMAGRMFVFIEEDFYEWEKFAVYEVLASGGRRLLTVGAGGC
jgi:hypothetical protein